jgi:hypothetical protein
MVAPPYGLLAPAQKREQGICLKAQALLLYPSSRKSQEKDSKKQDLRPENLLKIALQGVWFRDIINLG